MIPNFLPFSGISGSCNQAAALSSIHYPIKYIFSESADPWLGPKPNSGLFAGQIQPWSKRLKLQDAVYLRENHCFGYFAVRQHNLYPFISFIGLGSWNTCKRPNKSERGKENTLECSVCWLRIPYTAILADTTLQGPRSSMLFCPCCIYGSSL